MIRRRRHKCRSCGQLYQPDPRNAYHQRHCSLVPCQQASKVISQRRWRRSPKGRDYFYKGTANTLRVRAWRMDHPGYWRKPRQKSIALQDVLIAQPHLSQGDKPILNETRIDSPTPPQAEFSYENPLFDAHLPHALQDVLSAQLSLQLGLIDQLNGGLQDDIAPFVQRLIIRGQQIQGRWMDARCNHAGGQTSAVSETFAKDAEAVQLDRSTPGSG